MTLALGFLFLLCVALLGFYAYSLDQWRKERTELIQRIQAPESAVLAYAREQKGAPEPVPTLALDDDEGYEALRLRREGLTPN
jgi:hypothetical protein